MVFSLPSVHLRSMTTGEPHPAAQRTRFGLPPTANLSRYNDHLPTPSITNSRLALIVGSLYVWDWRMGRILVEKSDCFYYTPNSINEYSFVMLSNWASGHPQLHVFDTECRTTLKPIQTTFSISGVPYCLLSEPCSYAPSSDEFMAAPFYPDPSQRILALRLGPRKWYTVKTRQLLELAQKRGNRCVEWSEWGEMVKFRDMRSERVWVSGFRLFSLVLEGLEAHLQVYDCSGGSRPSEGERERKMPSSSRLYRLPWRPHQLLGTNLIVGHDTIVFDIEDAPGYDNPNRTMHLYSI